MITWKPKKAILKALMGNIQKHHRNVPRRRSILLAFVHSIKLKKARDQKVKKRKKKQNPEITQRKSKLKLYLKS